MSSELEKWIQTQTGISKLYVHDFKNPVSAIAANVSYLEAVLDNVDEDVKGAVSDSAVAIRMLLHMLDNYLNISRLEADEQVEAVPVPLDRFFEEAMTKIKNMFTTMEPVLVIGSQIPSTMCYWPVMHARLAVENLILQSMHNTPSSGKVLLDVRVEAGMMELRVSDNGVEISPDFYDKTFLRDFQLVAKSEEHARYARSLGLYAVGLATKAMGGTINVSRRGELQIFTLCLPVEVDR